MTTSTSKNDITGDLIKTKTTTKQYRDGWDAIFGKQERAWKEQDKVELKECPTKRGGCFCTGVCMQPKEKQNRLGPCWGHEVENQKEEEKND